MSNRSRRNQRGQATIEYILVLSIAVMIASIVLTKLVRPMSDKVTDSVSKTISDLFSKNVYQIRLGR